MRKLHTFGVLVVICSVSLASEGAAAPSDQDMSRMQSRSQSVFGQLVSKSAVYVGLFRTFVSGSTGSSDSVTSSPYDKRTTQSILEFISSAGGAADEISDQQLSQISTKYGVSWWQVYGELMVATELGNALVRKDYKTALNKAALYTNGKLIAGTTSGRAILGASSIGSFAALPVTYNVKKATDAFLGGAAEDQRVAYFQARDELGLTHDQIVSVWNGMQN